MSNTEIEFKYKINNQAEINKKLKDLGAKFVKEFESTDTYFMVPENKKGKKYLRVREQGKKVELAYHFAASHIKTEEWEIAINDAQTAKEILQKIGHKLDVIVKKIRKVYSYKNSEIVIDNIEGLGQYIEIESPNLEELIKIEKLFGFNKSMRISDRGYPDMIRGYLISK